MVKIKIDIIETFRRCIENPTVTCCSYGLVATNIILWHLAKTKGWLTTKEICNKAKFRSCNKARVYMYKLKEKGIVKTSKLFDNQTIWQINENILKNKDIDLKQLQRLLNTHYIMCLEYYKTGILKKPEEKPIST
jgi:hypothetical protein